MLVLEIPNGVNGNLQITISDMAGRIVYSKQEMISTQVNIILPGLPSLPNGTYLLSINSNKGEKVLKIIKD
jgi:hypothetical protein